MAEKKQEMVETQPTEQAQAQPMPEVEVKVEAPEAAAPAEEPSEPTTQKDVWLANMRKKYPDAKEDELYAIAMKNYDTDHDYRKETEASSKAFADLVNQEPEIAKWYKDVSEGVDPGVAMLNLGDVYKAYMNGDIDSEGFKAERSKRDAEIKAKDESVAKQAKALEEWCKEKGYEPLEWLKQANEKLFTAMSSYALDKAQFDALDKMFNYDADIEAAAAKGRNENIMAQRKEFSEKKGDGMIAGSPAGGTSAPKEPSRWEAMQQRRKLARDL